MAQPPLYLISGLGADERLFQVLHLHHPTPRMIHWIRPAPSDSMASYALKLTKQILPGEEPPILIGLSYGGMIAQEIAKQIPIKRLILISTLVNTDQLAFHYRLWGFLRLPHWFPFHLAKKFTSIGGWLFGTKTPEDFHIFHSIIQDTDVPTLRWLITHILTWKNECPPIESVVIHGDRDKILPIPRCSNLHIIKGGEHLIVLNRAREVGEIVNQYLN
jgi:pimeloyl-ACP methyl ester carboxylesterase